MRNVHNSNGRLRAAAGGGVSESSSGWLNWQFTQLVNVQYELQHASTLKYWCIRNYTPQSTSPYGCPTHPKPAMPAVYMYWFNALLRRTTGRHITDPDNQWHGRCVGRTFTGFIQVRENWKRSGNFNGQGKSGKMQKWLESHGNFGGKFYLFVQLL